MSKKDITKTRRHVIEIAKNKLGLKTNNIITIVKAIWMQTHGKEILKSKLTNTVFINQVIFEFSGVCRAKKTERSQFKYKKSRKTSKDFYNSKEWRRLRYKALKLYGRKCLCCGQKAPNVELHVDHIKPRSKYPELELDINNLQILCKDCNLGKSNTDEIDYRNDRDNVEEKLDLILIKSSPI